MHAFRFALPLLLMAGCTWISGKDQDCRLLLVDDDGDGYPLNRPKDPDAADPCAQLVPVDCDDGRPEIHPDADETWYDGVDSNCDAADDFDKDGDGFAALGYSAESTLDSSDCDDEEPEIHPGATDAWYDGVDADCGGEDDFDQDGDGFAAIGYEGRSSLPTTDCDDHDAALHPGQEDAWYDGVDADCGGEDDFDQDGDGYALIGSEGSSLPATDCDDLRRDVNPGQAEIWYDGLDQDCRGDDDYDRDADGYARIGTTGSTLPATDCDDARAAINPAATEVLGDSLDQDCDGGPDAFLLGPVVDWTFDGPRALRFEESDTDLVLVGFSDGVTNVRTSAETRPAGTVFSFNLADPGAGPTGVSFWLESLSSMMTLTEGLGTLLEGSSLTLAFGAALTEFQEIILRGYDVASGRISWSRAGSPATLSGATLEDVSMASDAAGDVHAVGCFVQSGGASDAFPFMVRTPAATIFEPTVSGVLTADHCVLDFFEPGGQGSLLLRERSGDDAWLSVHTFTPCTSSPCTLEFRFGATWTEYDPLLMRSLASAAGRWLVFHDAFGDLLRVLEVSVDRSGVWSATEIWSLDLSSAPPTSLDAFIVEVSPLPVPETRTLYLAWTDTEGRIGLAWGVPRPGASFSTSWLDAGLDAERVALHVTDGTLLLAVMGEDSAGDGQLHVGHATAE